MFIIISFKTKWNFYKGRSVCFLKSYNKFSALVWVFYTEMMGDVNNGCGILGQLLLIVHLFVD